ncbi:MAG: thiamine diphosphokinase [candidate division Zixibacteria bacterium]|nr:thiamine diphosphokinase [candidate division Zixibacteria bacterium]
MEKRKKRRGHRTAAIFLNGAYPTEHLDFYRQAISQAAGERIIIAVDGALTLFAKLDLRPQVVLGDFDSVDPAVLAQFEDCERVEYPRDKDATDGELAVRYALEHECRQIEIYGAIDTSFETDQMLANIFLLDFIQREGSDLKPPPFGELLDHRQRIWLWSEGTIQFAGKAGEQFSVIPLSTRVRLSIEGAKWNLKDKTVYRGESWTLRNEMVGDEVSILLRGTAIVIHRKS